MNNGEKSDDRERRIFRRYGGSSACTVTIGAESWTGTVEDYSADGICIVVNDGNILSPGIAGRLSVDKPPVEFPAQVVWVDDKPGPRRVGFRRLEAIQGDLDDFYLSDLLLGLQRSGQTGAIVVRKGGSTKKIFLKGGDIIYATSTVVDDRLGEFLVREGTLSPEQYNRSVEELRRTGQKQGKILVDLGYLSPKELFRAVRRQVEAIILSLFRPDPGHFAFREGRPPEGEIITLRLSAASLIYRGAKKYSIEDYGETLPGHKILRFSEDPLDLFQKIPLTEGDREIISLIDGSRTLDDLLAASPADRSETLKTVSALLQTRMARLVSPERIRSKPNVSAAQVLTEQETEPGTDFVRSVESMYETCVDTDAVQILGVREDADPVEINKAYFALAKRFHPDRRFSLPTEELREKLQAIFQHVGIAHEFLLNENRSAENTGNKGVSTETPPEPETPASSEKPGDTDPEDASSGRLGAPARSTSTAPGPIEEQPDGEENGILAEDSPNPSGEVLSAPPDSADGSPPAFEGENPDPVGDGGKPPGTVDGASAGSLEPLPKKNMLPAPDTDAPDADTAAAGKTPGIRQINRPTIAARKAARPGPIPWVTAVIGLLGLIGAGAYVYTNNGNGFGRANDTTRGAEATLNTTSNPAALSVKETKIIDASLPEFREKMFRSLGKKRLE